MAAVVHYHVADSLDILHLVMQEFEGLDLKNKYRSETVPRTLHKLHRRAEIFGDFVLMRFDEETARRMANETRRDRYEQSIIRTQHLAAFENQ